jgi:hypothetical protein
MPWVLRKKPSGVPRPRRPRPIQPIRPIKPIKPLRPIKPIAPPGYVYVWKD